MAVDNKIIIIDDDLDFLKIVKSHLLNSGFKDIRTEDNSMAAVSLFERGADFDIALIDMTMPQMDGLAVLEIIKNISPRTECIKTEWVRPGRAVWRYLDGGDRSFEGMKGFSRMAGLLGFEYHVIEGFWSRWSDEQIKEIADYSREHGVGLLLWRHSNRLGTSQEREEFFSRLHSLGIAGAKIDFLDHEAKEVVDHYEQLLEKAAEYKMVVNFHGANKPTGRARTWPNEIVREAVRGMESRSLRERARHESLHELPADVGPFVEHGRVSFDDEAVALVLQLADL